MPWYFYLAEMFGGAFLTNGIPHFVHGVSGHRFPSPFGTPRGIGESSALSNALWGWANLAVGGVLLWFFTPYGAQATYGWIVWCLGGLLISIISSIHFGKVSSRALSK